jgi:hypothetical protein
MCWGLHAVCPGFQPKLNTVTEGVNICVPQVRSQVSLEYRAFYTCGRKAQVYKRVHMSYILYLLKNG